MDDTAEQKRLKAIADAYHRFRKNAEAISAEQDALLKEAMELLRSQSLNEAKSKLKELLP